MTTRGRYRCDYQPSSVSQMAAEQTWHATKEAAYALEAVMKAKHGGRAVAWWWPGEYVETPGEEAARLVREGLVARVPWLRWAA